MKTLIATTLLLLGFASVSAADRPATATPTESDGASATEVAKQFLLADGVEAKLKFVRFPEKIAPLMRAWYSTHSPKPVQATRDDIAVSLTKWIYVADMKFIVVTLQLLPEYNYKFFPLESTATGWKLDWETAVGWQPMSAEEFRKSRPTSSNRFRVHVGPSDYYNGPYRDEARWLCCKLTNPQDDSFQFFGYIERASVGGKLLAGRFAADESPSAILALSFPAERGDANQVTIHSIVSNEWFLKSGPATELPVGK